MMISYKKETPRDQRKKTEAKGMARGTGTVTNTPCAFHPNQKITNFCTNRQCLLPLCPKCVKIHTEEHVKMGIFGEFDTIQESFAAADEGLKSNVARLGEFQKTVVTVRESFDSKISNERKVLRQAKNYFIQDIERIFDGFEKALMAYEHEINQYFFQHLCNAEQLLSRLSENCQKALRRLSSPQTLMEGIINYYTELQELECLDTIGEILQQNSPASITLSYEPQELDRLQNTIKRYIDAGAAQDYIWEHYNQLFHKEEPTSTKGVSPPRSNKKEAYDTFKVYSTRKSPPKDKTPQKRIVDNPSINELSIIQDNLNLGRFKTPLQKYSITKRRQERKQMI